MSITIAYTPEYLKWTGSHASPQRAALAVEHLIARDEDIEFLDPDIRVLGDVIEDLKRVHAKRYIHRVLRGEEPGHEGKLQGHTAAIMFQGTRLLADAIEANEYAPGVYFNPQGAKHHAAYSHASGFCVFNDMAWAAQHFTEQGLKVAYLDWDAHHGDGVEALTRANPNVLTASIHEWGIFPGTGVASDPAMHVYNYPLPSRSPDSELIRNVKAALEVIEAFQPDILLMAIGADGHTADPLTSLEFSLEGFTDAARKVGRYAKRAGIPILAGGAGGYTPFTYTPVVWAEVIRTLDYEIKITDEERSTALLALEGDEG